MKNVERFQKVIDVEKKRPKSAAFGIGGAGRNIISSFDSENFSNIDIYEVGEKNRLNIYPTIKVYRKDIKKNIETSLSYKYREKTHSENILENYVQDYDVLYILCGLGGEMGSCVSTICSHLCNKLSVFSVALFATPFETESPSRIEFSRKTRTELEGLSDISVAFSNSKLLKMNPQLSLKKAFDVMNNIISIPMEDLNPMLTKEDIPGLTKFCEDVEGFRVGAGYGKGREKGKRALRAALRSPWIEMDNCNKIIALITRGETSSKYDVQDILDSLKSRFPDAEIMYGIRKHKSLDERIRVTILVGE